MKMSYQTNDRLSYQDVNPGTRPLRLVRRMSAPRRAARVVGALLTMAAVLAVPALLFHDFLGAPKARTANSRAFEKTSQLAVASLEELMRRALHGAAYVAGWSKLVARNLGDFEDAVALVKTPFDPRHPTEVENRRRQGAQALIAILERNGLLAVMGEGRSREQLAIGIGRLLSIEPSSVSRTFRESQEAQIAAIRSALERHLSDAPGPSDLSVFGAETASNR